MVSSSSSWRRAASNPGQILPDRAQLQAALDDPSLQREAEVALAQLSAPRPLSLTEHRLAADWLRRKSWGPRQAILRAVAFILLVLGAGLSVWAILYLTKRTDDLRPIASGYYIPVNDKLALPSHAPTSKEVLRIVRPGEELKFPILPLRTPPPSAPSVDALVFVLQDERLVKGVDLLQPQRRSPQSLSFYVEAQVDVLLEQHALHPGDNQLYVVVGRPAALPRTGDELQQALNTSAGQRDTAPRTWEIFHVTTRILGRAQ